MVECYIAPLLQGLVPARQISMRVLGEGQRCHAWPIHPDILWGDPIHFFNWISVAPRLREQRNISAMARPLFQFAAIGTRHRWGSRH
jgi:hypothetical protein